MKKRERVDLHYKPSSPDNIKYCCFKFLHHIFFGDVEGDRLVRRPLWSFHDILVANPVYFYFVASLFLHYHLTWLEANTNLLT